MGRAGLVSPLLSRFRPALTNGPERPSPARKRGPTSFGEPAHPRRALIGAAHRVAAIDRKIDPGDVACLVRAQEEHGARDLLGVADAAERMILAGDAVGLGAVAL